MPPSPRPTRDRRWPGRLAAVVAGTALAVLLAGAVAAPAGAHVSIKPDVAKKGSFSVFSFSVPNESSTASTVKLEVTFPTDHPIAFVSVQPIPGWTWTSEKTTLAKPLKTEDGEITQAISKVTWSGGTIGPGEFQLFTISAGPLPTDTKSLEFKAVQTYSDGTVVRWIEATPKGGPEPEHPAPVLKLAGKSTGH
jgi:periplasmic copper chaperone A